MEGLKQSKVSFHLNEPSDKAFKQPPGNLWEGSAKRGFKTVILSDEEKQQLLANFNSYLNSSKHERLFPSLSHHSTLQVRSPGTRDYSRNYSKLPCPYR